MSKWFKTLTGEWINERFIESVQLEYSNEKEMFYIICAYRGKGHVLAEKKFQDYLEAQEYLDDFMVSEFPPVCF